MFPVQVVKTNENGVSDLKVKGQNTFAHSQSTYKEAAKVENIFRQHLQTENKVRHNYKETWANLLSKGS